MIDIRPGNVTLGVDANTLFMLTDSFEDVLLEVSFMQACNDSQPGADLPRYRFPVPDSANFAKTFHVQKKHLPAIFPWVSAETGSFLPSENNAGNNHAS